MKKQPGKDRLSKLRAVVSDVDGVLTDATKFYSSTGLALLGFNARDGLGLYLLGRCGFRLALITTTDSDIINARALDLSISDVLRNEHDKRGALLRWRTLNGLAREEVLYIGDDLWDIEAFAEAGVSVAVADADPRVKQEADWITQCQGGRGAIREVADMILEAHGINVLEIIRSHHYNTGTNK